MVFANCQWLLSVVYFSVAVTTAQAPITRPYSNQQCRIFVQALMSKATSHNQQRGCMAFHLESPF